MTIEFFNCNHALITTDFFQDMLNSLVYKIDISVDINCCNKPFTKTLTIDNVVNGSYTLTPAFFGFTDNLLPNGVYKVDVTAYYGSAANNTSIQGDVKCKFHNCDLTCKVIDHVAKDSDTEAHLHLFLLDSMGECPCQCDNMCEVYKLLLKELNSDPTKTETIPECWTCKK